MLDMHDVSLVTDRRQPVDPLAQSELTPLLAALRHAGLTATTTAWDAPDFDPEAAKRFVLRTPWDYYLHRDRFVAWARSVPQLLNPPAIVEWNSHKRYLTQLRVPTIDTEWVLDGERSLAALLQTRGWVDAVLKPAVSAGAHKSLRFSSATLAQAQHLLKDITRDCEAMVQPYLPEVEREGERSLIYFNGRFSHAVRRLPVLAIGAHRAEPLQPTADELQFAERTLNDVPRAEALLYARVDMLKDSAGTLRLMELELIEPSCFIELSAGAPQRFAAAIATRLMQGG